MQPEFCCILASPGQKMLFEEAVGCRCVNHACILKQPSPVTLFAYGAIVDNPNCRACERLLQWHIRHTLLYATVCMSNAWQSLLATHSTAEHVNDFRGPLRADALAEIYAGRHDKVPPCVLREAVHFLKYSYAGE